MSEHIGFRHFSLLASLILGLSLTVAAWALLSVAGRSPAVALAQGSVRYVAPGGSDDGNLCADSATPCATVQRAVDVATPGDEIRIATGVYTDVYGRLAPDGYIGSAVVTQVAYISQSLSLRGGYTTTAFAGPPDPAAYPTTLDAQGQGRVLVLAGDIGASIEGLRITGGDASGLGGRGTGAGGGVYALSATLVFSQDQVISNTSGYGGGLYVEGGDLTLDGSIIASNTATIGGGLSVWNSTANLSDNRIISNTSGYDGGGLDLVGSSAVFSGNTIGANVAQTYYGGGLSVHQSAVTLTANTVSTNTAGLSGGGIYLYNGSQATLISNTLVANTASGASDYEGGGGLYQLDSQASLTGNTIISNTAHYGGGLAGGEGMVTLSGNAIMSNTADLGGGIVVGYGGLTGSGNVLAGNSAGYGGGMFLSSGITALTNTAIVANRAATASSGVEMRDVAADWRHTTVAGNTGGDGRGIQAYGSTIMTLTNTIMVSHTTGITAAAGSSAILDGVLWFGNEANINGAGIISVAHAYTGNPAFAADGYHLTAGSAAINRGIRAGVVTDIDGQSRDAVPDLGADEYPLDKKTYLPIVLRKR